MCSLPRGGGHPCGLWQRACQMVQNCPEVHFSLCHWLPSLCQEMNTFPSFSDPCLCPIPHTHTHTHSQSHMLGDSPHLDSIFPLCPFLSGGRLSHTLTGTFTNPTPSPITHTCSGVNL